MPPPVHAAGGLVGQPDGHGPRFSRADPRKEEDPHGKTEGPTQSHGSGGKDKSQDGRILQKKKPVQSDVAKPLAQVEEEKKREESSEA